LPSLVRELPSVTAKSADKLRPGLIPGGVIFPVMLKKILPIVACALGWIIFRHYAEWSQPSFDIPSKKVWKEYQSDLAKNPPMPTTVEVVAISFGQWRIEGFSAKSGSNRIMVMVSDRTRVASNRPITTANPAAFNPNPFIARIYAVAAQSHTWPMEDVEGVKCRHVSYSENGARYDVWFDNQAQFPRRLQLHRADGGATQVDYEVLDVSMDSLVDSIRMFSTDDLAPVFEKELVKPMKITTKENTAYAR
jgi:hypothetical protein